jgi:hypothetical protein
MISSARISTYNFHLLWISCLFFGLSLEHVSVWLLLKNSDNVTPNPSTSPLDCQYHPRTNRVLRAPYRW